MRYFNEQEIALLTRIIHKELNIKDTSFAYLLERIFDDPEDSSVEVSVIVAILTILETEKVLHFTEVKISDSPYYHNDIFFIKFFDTLKKDKTRAEKMLEMFDLEGLKEIMDYRKDNLGGLIDLIKKFTQKIRRIYFTDREVPFMVSLIKSIDFSVKTDDKKLEEFMDIYTGGFMDDMLTNPHAIDSTYDEDGTEHYIYGQTYYPYHTQRLIFLNTAKESVKQYGYRNQFLYGNLANKPGFKKFETLWAMKKEGLIKFSRIQESVSDLPHFDIDKDIFEAEYQKYKTEIDNLLKKIEGDDGSVIYMGKSEENFASKYMDKTKILKIKDKEVMINRTNKETDQTKLLQTIFSNPRKTWHADEIYESWSENPIYFKDKNTIDTARRHINNKAKQQAQLKDEFLQGNNQWVKVNPDYL